MKQFFAWNRGKVLVLNISQSTEVLLVLDDTARVSIIGAPKGHYFHNSAE